MCKSGQVSNAAGASAPYMYSAYNTGVQNNLDLLHQYGEPEMANVNAIDLEKMMQVQQKLSKLENDKYERETNPELYKSRQEVKKQIYDRLVNPDALLQKSLVQAGLMDAIATGNDNFGENSRGNAITRGVLGKGYLDYNRQALADANAYNEANPQVAMRLNPTDYTNLVQGQKNSQANLRNLYKQQLLGAGQNATTSLANYGQNLMNGIITESGNNAASVSSAANAFNTGMFNLGSSAIQAAGMAAAGSAAAA